MTTNNMTLEPRRVLRRGARVEQHAIGGADDVDGPTLSIQVKGPERSISTSIERSHVMRQIVRIGLDIVKRWFQVHAVDEAGKEIFNRKLTRDKVLGFLGSLPACEVALEACSSSHHWGREIGQLGHRVRLISPNYVKPFVKRGKSDAHDARAICEAASRPDMRFVRVKTEKQQAALMQHTSRQLLIDQRTAVANSLRGQLAEFGVIEKQGIKKSRRSRAPP